MGKKYLEIYAAWVVRHAKGIVISAFVLSAILVAISMLFLKTQTGVLDLYSKDDPMAQRFMTYVDAFGAVETLIVVFEGTDEAERRRAMDQLAKLLDHEADQYIQNIFYKLDLTLFEKHALEFLNPKQRENLLREVEKPDSGLRALFAARSFNDYLRYLNDSIAAGIQHPKSSDRDNSAQFRQGLEPMLLLEKVASGEKLTREDIAESIRRSAKARATVDAYGYLRTDNHQMHVMMLRPLDRKQDYRIAKPMLELVRKKIDIVRKTHPGVTMGVTGGPALNNDQFEISQKDMSIASTFAFLSTGILFMVAFKSFGRPLLGLLTLSLSITWCFGMTTLTVGHLNMFSMAFMVILIGEGTYYGVHVVSRYEEELAQQRPVPEAIRRTIIHVFGNVTTSTVTTSAAFFATMLVGLRGFAELGWIAGTGVILSSIGMQMVLPALLLLYDRKGPRQSHRLKKGEHDWISQGTERRYGQRLTRWLHHGAPYLIAFTVGIAGYGAYLFFSPKHGIPFDSNILNLQAKNTEAVRYEKKLIATSISPRAGIFVTPNREQASLWARELEKLKTVQRVEWLGAVFPQDESSKTLEQLRRAIQALPLAPLQSIDLSDLKTETGKLQTNLEKISELALNYPFGEKLLEVSEEALGRLTPLNQALAARSDPAPLQSRLDDFQKNFFDTTRQVLSESASVTPLRLEDLPKPIVQQFLSSSGLYAVYAFPSENIWEREPLHRFIQDLRSVSSEVTGPPVMFYEIVSLVRQNYFKAAAYAAVIIFFTFWIDFRSLRYAVLAFTPLLLGIGGLFVCMHFFNLSFNTANLISLPLILGIGADNGVHIIHRFREERETNLAFLFGSTGKALMITFCDTITSFAGLAWANHQGLAQLGRIVVVGIICCTIAGFLFLPSVLSLMMRRGKLRAVPKPEERTANQEERKLA